MKHFYAYVCLSVLSLGVLFTFIVYLIDKEQSAMEPMPVTNKAQVVIPESLKCLKCHTNCYNEFPEDLPLFNDLWRPNYDQE